MRKFSNAGAVGSPSITPLLLVILIFQQIAISFGPSCSSCQAEEPSSRGLLFSRRAAETAEALGRSFSKESPRHLRGTPERVRESSGSVASDLKIDRVDDIILSDKGQRSLLADYRSISYLRYIQDFVELRALDEWEQGTVAQRVLIYQSLRTISDYLIASPLEQVYRHVLRHLQVIKRYTTVQVSRECDGGVDVHHGQKNASRLLEFKIHASARYGVQPRLSIFDDLTFRYDVLEDDLMLEFRYDF